MSKLLHYLLPCMLVTAAVSCEEAPEDGSGDTVPVEKMELNLEGISNEMIRTRTFQLQVSFYPENATDKKFTWINSNPEVVSITEEGLLTAELEGEAIIGAQLVNGNKRAVARITVTPYIAENPIRTITFDKTNHDFSDIGDAPITITPTFEAMDDTQPPTDPYLKWSSSDNFVVQVDQNGKVTIIGGGSAVVRGEAIDGGNAFAECTVTVPGTAIKDRLYDSVGPLYADNYYKKVYEPLEIVVPVIDRSGNKTGETETQVWLDRNLGASRRATESVPGANDAHKDCESFGSYFQWSRKADGHEKVTGWNLSGEDPVCTLTPTTGEAAADRADVGHSSFITINDWASNAIDGLWGGAKPFSVTAGSPTDTQFASLSYHAAWNDPTQANNPCPYGYRVPSPVELHQLMLALSGLDKILINSPNTVTNATEKFSMQPPYLPFSGNRANNKAEVISNFGGYIMLWTNTSNSAKNGWSMRIQSNGNNLRLMSQQRGVGYPIRCIKD